MSAKHLKPGTIILPQDIIEFILLHLPAKPLLRFKSVSKSWYTSISDPVFVQNHLHQSKTSNSRNLFLCQFTIFGEDPFSLVKIVDDEKIQTLQGFKVPCGFIRVLCHGAGVLLLTAGARHSPTVFVLWNPSTRTSRKFQFPYRDQINIIDSHKCYGLCHDPRTGDVKVVVILSDHYAVYSCKNKAWTKKQGTFRVGNRPGVFVDGVVYWLKEEENSRYQLTYFDPIDDEFKMSEFLEVQATSYVTELEGRLCLCYEDRFDNVHIVHILIKEKGVDNNSWKEILNVENATTFIWRFEPVSFVENKVVIRFGGMLVVYSPLAKTSEEIDGNSTHNSGFHYMGFQSFPYLDSLVSPTHSFLWPNRKRKMNVSE